MLLTHLYYHCSQTLYAAELEVVTCFQGMMMMVRRCLQVSASCLLHLKYFPDHYQNCFSSSLAEWWSREQFWLEVWCLMNQELVAFLE